MFVILYRDFRFRNEHEFHLQLDTIIWLTVNSEHGEDILFQ